MVAPTALVSLLWIVVTWSTSHYLAQLDDLQTQVVQEKRMTIRSAGAMLENLWRLQAVLLEAAEHGERSGLVDERFTAEAADLERSFELALGTVDWQRLPRLMETWLSSGETDLYRRGLEHFDRLVIRRAMDQAGGNQARAAEILGSAASPCGPSCERSA